MIIRRIKPQPMPLYSLAANIRDYINNYSIGNNYYASKYLIDAAQLLTSNYMENTKDFSIAETISSINNEITSSTHRIMEITRLMLNMVTVYNNTTGIIHYDKLYMAVIKNGTAEILNRDIILSAQSKERPVHVLTQLHPIEDNKRLCTLSFQTNQTTAI